MNNPDTHNGTPGSDRQHTIRTVSLGTFWRMFRYPFILLSVSIIPRQMGPETYGQYAFFVSIYVIFEYFSDVGITQIFGRFIPDLRTRGDDAGAAHLFHGFLFYGACLSLILVALLALLSFSHTFASFPPHWFIILGGILIFSQIQGILFAFMYGMNQIARYSSKEVMRSACTFLLVLGMYLKFGLTGALCGLILNEIVATIVGVAWTRAWLFRPWTRIHFRDFTPYFLFGLHFYLPVFLFGTMMRSGNVFIRWLTGLPEQVSYFDIANQFLLLTATFLGLILSTLLPSLTSLYAKGQHAAIDQYHRMAMTYCAVVVFLAYNALGWLGPYVLAAVMGPEFAPVFPNALILILGIFPSLIAYVGINYTVLKKQPKVYATAIVTGFATMIAAFCILIPRFASAGAALATVLGYVAFASVFLRVYRREFAVVLGGFVKVALLGLLFVPLYYFRLKPLPALAAYCFTSLAYVAILSLLRLISYANLEQVIHAFRAGKPSAPQDNGFR